MTPIERPGAKMRAIMGNDEAALLRLWEEKREDLSENVDRNDRCRLDRVTAWVTSKEF
jgi:hypothetical protein